MDAERDALISTLREMILSIVLARDLDLTAAAQLAMEIIDQAIAAADGMLAR